MGDNLQQCWQVEKFENSTVNVGYSYIKWALAEAEIKWSHNSMSASYMIQTD